jgi:hypothetical protein
VDDPDYWRFRATNTRELAKESSDPSTKSVLAKIAETYEALAERAEERLRQKPQVWTSQTKLFYRIRLRLQRAA